MSGRWGQARLEVEVLKEEILERLGRGLTVRQIYDEFVHAGHISVKAAVFYKRVKKIRDARYPSSDTTRPSTPPRLVNGALDVIPLVPDKPSPPPPGDHVWGKPASPREGFGHKSDGATDDFLDSVYGITPSSPDDKESAND